MDILSKRLDIMNKKIIFLYIITITLFYSVNSYAQQEAQFSHNMFNILSYNPAFAGSNDQICVNAFGRQQWMGFSETMVNIDDGTSQTYNVNPETFLFSIDANVNPLRGGIGAVIYKDKLGHEENIGVKFGYAYKKYIGQGMFSVGLMAGFLNKTINFAEFSPIDKGDPLLNSSIKENDMIFDVAAGLFYKVPGSYYAGISTSQILESGSSFQTPNIGSPDLKRHYYINAGYQYTIPSAPEFELLPSILIKTDFASTQYDINALLLWNSQFWGGLTYRPIDAVVVLAGARPLMTTSSDLMAPLGIGVAYDITTSNMGYRGRSSGTFEVFINYCFKIVYVPPVSSYKNVKFL